MGLILGTDRATGRPVELGDDERNAGLYILGISGTGKSMEFRNLIVQDMEAGRGLCFLDPHGDVCRELLRYIPKHRASDVVFIDLSNASRFFGINLFRCSDPTDFLLRNRVPDQAVEVFKKSWGDSSWGPLLEDLLGNIAETLVDNPGFGMRDIPDLLTNEDCRRFLVAHVRNPIVRHFWEEEYGPMRDREQREHYRSTINKVRAFLRNLILQAIVSQSESSIDFREAMDTGKIVLVNLAAGAVGDSVVSLIGSVIISQIVNAALSRENIPESNRRQFNLFCDEYQRFATPDFAILLTEARKFRIATTMAHQGRYQQDFDNRGATLGVSNVLVFRVSPPDSQDMAGLFRNDPQPSKPSPRMLTTPAMRTWTEVRWEPPQAEAELAALLEEKNHLQMETELFATGCGFGPVDFQRYNGSPSSFITLGEALKSSDPGRLERLHRVFNPAFESEQVRPYTTGSDWAQGYENAYYFTTGFRDNLDRMPAHSYSIPGDYPTNIEVYLATVVRQGMAEGKDHVKAAAQPRGDFTQRKQAAAALLAELKTVLGPIKRRAVYRYVPAKIKAYRPGPWETKEFPEMVSWVKQKVMSCQKRLEEMEARQKFLEACRKVIPRSEHLGYELPQREVIGFNRYGEPEEINRYVMEEGNPRARNDVKEEIANELTNLDNRQVKYRILRGLQLVEGTLETLAPSQPTLTPSEVEAIRQRSLVRYSKTWEEIEEEVAKRRAQWQRPEVNFDRWRDDGSDEPDMPQRDQPFNPDDDSLDVSR